MKDELSKLKFKEEERQKLPLGYRQILTKKVFPAAVEKQLILRSDRDQKITFGALKSPKPISKIIA